MENLVIEHSAQGIAHNADAVNGIRTGEITISNMSVYTDKRFDSDDAFEHHNSGTIATHSNKLSVENAWHYSNNVNWKPFARFHTLNPRIVDSYVYDCKVKKPCLPGINYSKTPIMDFAPKSKIGKFYVSPFRSY